MNRARPFWPFALLAVLVQLILGGVAAPALADGPSADLAALSVLCQAGQPGRPASGTHHHHQDPALCPICAALTLPAVALTPAPALPMPATMRAVAWERLRPARPAPSRAVAAAYPRGPPIPA